MASTDIPTTSTTQQSPGSGRFTECTPERYAAYLDELRIGMPLRLAAAAGNLDYSTVIDWRMRGENGEEPFAAFADDEQRALADFARKHLKAIDGADAKGFVSHAWLLERRLNGEFAQRQEVTLAGDADRPLHVVADAANLSADALAAELARRQAQTQQGDAEDDGEDTDPA